MTPQFEAWNGHWERVMNTLEEAVHIAGLPARDHFDFEFQKKIRTPA